MVTGIIGRQGAWGQFKDTKKRDTASPSKPHFQKVLTIARIDLRQDAADGIGFATSTLEVFHSLSLSLG
jgi:hypothetical protein